MSLSAFPPGMIVVLAAAGVALIGVHFWLSRRNPVWLGALIPVAYVVLIVVLNAIRPDDFEPTVPSFLVIIALLVIWWSGEGERVKRRGGPSPSGPATD